MSEERILTVFLVFLLVAFFRSHGFEGNESGGLENPSGEIGMFDEGRSFLSDQGEDILGDVFGKGAIATTA